MPVKAVMSHQSSVRIEKRISDPLELRHNATQKVHVGALMAVLHDR